MIYDISLAQSAVTQQPPPPHGHGLAVATITALDGCGEGGEWGVGRVVGAVRRAWRCVGLSGYSGTTPASGGEYLRVRLRGESGLAGREALNTYKSCPVTSLYLYLS